jgi:hypothetical protein
MTHLATLDVLSAYQSSGQLSRRRAPAPHLSQLEAFALFVGRERLEKALAEKPWNVRRLARWLGVVVGPCATARGTVDAIVRRCCR